MLPLLSELTSVADPSERDRRLGKIRGSTLDDMINEELIVQAGEQAKIEVEPSEIQAALDEIKRQNQIDDAGLLQLLAAEGFTLQNYKTDLRRQILRLRTINTIVAPKVFVSASVISCDRPRFSAENPGTLAPPCPVGYGLFWL